MTNKDVITKIIADITGRSVSEAEVLAFQLNALKSANKIDLDQERTKEEAEFLVSELLKREDEIRKMLIKYGIFNMSSAGLA